MKKLLSLMLSISILFTACNSDNEAEQDPKPVLPPEYSMAPNFDDFKADNNQRNQTIENWFYSALNVGVYSAILTGGLAIPVTAFKATISQNPIYDTDSGVWVWETSFTNNANDFSIRLTADVVDANVNWVGSISSTSLNVENFVWFDGQSNIDGNSGTWTLYESPQKPTAWITADWSRNEAQTVANANFTIEKEGDLLGSYINYAIDDENNLDRSVEISNTESGDLIEIYWNQELKFGRVKSEKYFGDTDFHCWDEDLQDVECAN
ncbi:hypothetical protein [Marivirga arenosa]|uniref:Lipoprotein n=1 Tax=Marivirga arenosa TaxID=3059076 RepID=A0AA51N6G7_9BACT|nr:MULTISPECIES: hypothetical protein [unclassified Marivirga]WMN07211.1 hypothetical protein QYS48_28170 [Marivirga sp. ABR2-2]WNB18591.1 hypothetical protein QYS47_30695 [Marivirga sp. BKB1-2]